MNVTAEQLPAFSPIKLTIVLSSQEEVNDLFARVAAPSEYINENRSANWASDSFTQELRNELYQYISNY